ncbi:MAG TPA: glycoside hydrolase 43 family protein [Opitutaceae bacterium]
MARGAGGCLRLLTLCLVTAALHAAEPAAPVLSWGDQGDGTFRNPVLFADYSDPDVIRVGDDFYLISSDFHFVGIQVLHSRDLVNWRIIGQVFNRLGMDEKYDRMAGYAQGTWAPSLRYHNGRFHLYVCTPHEGLFLWTAADPAGPWSEMVTVKRVDRWEDPCPLWDDDGQAYLVHSVLGAGPLILHRMSADGTRLLDDGVEIYRGPVAEGPKFYKRNGWYYLSLPEGGVEKGGQTILRARNIYGPYERREVLPPGSPHQGGLVELDNGEAWFIGFKSTGHFGRVAHLLPVTWGADDWPVFGDQGEPVAHARKPSLPVASVSRPQTDDTFSASTLGVQWQWNHNPLADAWSVRARPGWLRLAGQPAENLALARNTLTQRLWGPAGAVTVKLDVSALSAGQRAGLTFISGKVFNAVGVVAAEGSRRLFCDETAGPELAQDTVYLRSDYRGEVARLQYSLDGETFHDLGSPVTLKFGQWKGARVGLFAFGPAGGHADFDDFTYVVHPTSGP